MENGQKIEDINRNEKFIKKKIGNVALYYPNIKTGHSTDRNTETEVTIKTGAETDIQCLERIINQYQERDYHAQITACGRYEVMYQLAESRAHVIQWISLPENAAVLELGAGCGTLTSVLLKKGAHVTCQEENTSYAKLNAIRHKDSSMLEIFSMPFETCEPVLGQKYDCIIAIGVLAYAGPDLFRRLRLHLKPQGMFVVAVDNQFGLKYWAGCKEEHTHSYFTGLENQAGLGVHMYTKRSLERQFAEAGFTQPEFYYPYPDFRFARDIYSDRYLPRKGDLTYNIANYADDRLVLFDEEKVYDSIIEDGQFPLFSNAYLCIAKNNCHREVTQTQTQTHENSKPFAGLIYTRYADDRAFDYALRTDIIQTNTGREVHKRALYPQGAAHLAHIEKAYKKLCSQYENTGLKFNRCRPGDTKIEFEYLQGEPLQETVQQAVFRQDMKKVFDILRKVVQYIRNGTNNRQFVMTEAFGQVFGEVDTDIFTGENCSEVSDIDLTLPNIIVNKDGDWNVIDYEWTFFFPIPQNFLIYRMLFFLHLDNPGIDELSMDKLLSFAGIGDLQAGAFAEMEKAFQNFVTAGQEPYREMVNLLGRKYRNIVQLESDYRELSQRYQTLKSAGLYKVIRKLKNCFRPR